MRALDLAVDRAYSEHFLRRYFSLSLTDVAAPIHFVTFSNHKEVTQVGFVALKKYAPWQLRHYSGLAAMRHILRAESFEHADVVRGHHVPDAFWIKGGRKAAVEYDVGYSLAVRKAKVAAFAMYDEVYWGVGNLERYNSLRKTLPFKVVYAPW